MSIQRYDEFDEGGLREADKGEYVNYWDHCNKMTDTFAAKMRLAQQVDDHKAALAEKEAELEKARELLKACKDTFQDNLKVRNYKDEASMLKRFDEIAAYLGDKS